MHSVIEKVTLSLDKTVLEKLAKKANKSMSEFVRDLIQREKEMTDDKWQISSEIQALRGSLKASSGDTKDRVRKAVKSRFRKL